MPTDPFTYSALPMRVAFGQGLDPLGDQVRQLGINRAVVICTPDRAPLAHKVAQTVSSAVVEVMAEAVMHVPTAVVDRCEQHSRKLGCDGYLAVGGGSAIGLAKALALRTGAPIIAVPTTYAGS
ncbi:MAG: iron-containing alcohol dehydrogenase, partial [Comamonadaceae bacterium]